MRDTRPEHSYVKMPKELTAENGAKSALMGEFIFNTPEYCDCHGMDDDCEMCGGSGEYVRPINVPWVTIKAIYAAAVKLFASDNT